MNSKKWLKWMVLGVGAAAIALLSTVAANAADKDLIGLWAGGQIWGEANAIALNQLAVVRRHRVAFAAVQVALANDFGKQPQVARHAIEHLFDDQHALRPAEAAKRGVRHDVRLRDATHKCNIG